MPLPPRLPEMTLSAHIPRWGRPSLLPRAGCSPFDIGCSRPRRLLLLEMSQVAVFPLQVRLLSQLCKTRSSGSSPELAAGRPQPTLPLHGLVNDGPPTSLGALFPPPWGQREWGWAPPGHLPAAVARSFWGSSRAARAPPTPHSPRSPDEGWRGACRRPVRILSLSSRDQPALRASPVGQAASQRPCPALQHLGWHHPHFGDAGAEVQRGGACLKMRSQVSSARARPFSSAPLQVSAQKPAWLWGPHRLLTSSSEPGRVGWGSVSGGAPPAP